MSSLVINLTALIIGISLGFYFAVISVQSMGVLVHGLLTRRLPRGGAISGLCQNLGIACGLLGFTYRTMDLAVVGLLVIALGVVSGPGPASPLYAILERALLVAGMAGLGALSLMHSLL